MKKLILILILAVSHISHAEDTIMFGGDNWCPINCAADDDDKGFMVDAASEALAFSNIELTYMEMP